MHRPDALLFDLFGTLLHFDYSILPEVTYEGKPFHTTSVKIHRQMCDRFGLDCPFELFLREALASRRKIVEMRGPEEREFPSLRRFQLLAESLGLDGGAAELMVETHMQQMFQMMWLPEENRAVLEALRDMPMALASNFDHAPTARRALSKFELEPYFAHIFISDEMGWRKPGRNFFDTMISTTGFRPSSTVFVGDDPVCDIWGASQSGLSTAWIVGSVEPPVEPTWRLQKLPDLLDVLPRS